MSGAGQPRLEALDGTGLSVTIVAARWHETVMAGLLDGASRALGDARVSRSQVLRVPGSFELPVVVAAVAAGSPAVDAVVALGVVVRGGTPHFDYVCRAVTDGLTRVALDSGVPVGFGVLTCNDDAEALDRAGLPGAREDKGYEAAHAAIETALVLRGLRSPDWAAGAAHGH